VVSVVDVVSVLTNSLDAMIIGNKMKIRVKNEDGFELSTICRWLKLLAPDGKMRETDCANIESIFRIVQSIPSRKLSLLNVGWLKLVMRESRNRRSGVGY